MLIIPKDDEQLILMFCLDVLILMFCFTLNDEFDDEQLIFTCKMQLQTSTRTWR